MFKHILLPTDGSPLSEAAVERAVAFAKSVDARVTGFYAIPPFHLLSTQVEMLSDTRQQYEADSKVQAERFLAVISKAAAKSGVKCDCVSETNAHPYDAILRAAEKRGCDLIAMASHGRRGVQGLLIGSETNKVLTHTKLPVLVFH